MKRFSRVTLLLTLLFLLSGTLSWGCRFRGESPTPYLPPINKTFPATPAPGNPSGEDKIAAGRAVFERSCDACHPQGGAGLGPSLLGITARIGEEGVKAKVREGVGLMPAFTPEQLNEQELSNLLTFLKTLE
jgi:mono/diheme cytochrome c family protein